MRDIRDIIEELHNHPEYLIADIFIVSDVLDYIQDEINDELIEESDLALDYELNIDDLSKADIFAMKEYMESMMDQVWKHVDGIYPSYNNLPDLRKKIDRQIIIEEILNKKEE
jgi:hypothetical protein